MAELLTSTGVENHPVVSPAEWLASRKELLQKEKDFTRLRDELSARRRQLPWVKMDKNYVFDGPRASKASLISLRAGVN